MDPNANLSEQAELLEATDSIDKRRRSELRQALAEWLWRGGFEPDWKANKDAAKGFRKWQRNRAKFSDLCR